MNLLIFGLALWVMAHLFKRVLPGLRSSMGNAGRGLVTVSILAGIVLMVIGYGATEKEFLYELPSWVWHLNNLLMLVAVFLMGAGNAGGLVGSKIRHPMLLGVVIWVIAHLLVNGDMPSLILFGTMGAWALLEMIVINRGEGVWTPPPGQISKDILLAFISVIIFGVFVSVHIWLGYSVIGVFR